MAFLKDTIIAKKKELQKKKKYRFLDNPTEAFKSIMELRNRLRTIQNTIRDAESKTILSKIMTQFTYLKRELGNMSSIPDFFGDAELLSVWRVSLNKIRNALKNQYIVWETRKIYVAKDSGEVAYHNEVGRLVNQCTGILSDFDNAVAEFIQRAESGKPRQIEKGFYDLCEEMDKLMGIIQEGARA